MNEVVLLLACLAIYFFVDPENVIFFVVGWVIGKLICKVVEKIL